MTVFAAASSRHTPLSWSPTHQWPPAADVSVIQTMPRGNVGDVPAVASVVFTAPAASTPATGENAALVGICV